MVWGRRWFGIGWFGDLVIALLFVDWFMYQLVLIWMFVYDVWFTVVSWLMALDSQSDTVGFDEVYNRTRREHREVKRIIRRHRYMEFLLAWIPRFILNIYKH